MTWSIRNRLVFAATAAVVLGGLWPAAAQQPTSSPPPPQASRPATRPGTTPPADVKQPAAAAGQQPAKPGTEGLTVHGYWKIDVRNADGSLAAHREFENSLTSGANALFQLMTGQIAAGDLAIAVGGAGQADLCASGNGDLCYITISRTQGIGGAICPGLASAALCSTNMTESTSGSTGAVTVSGTILAATTTSITTVSTSLLTCAGTGGGLSAISPTTCFSIPAAGSAGITTTVSPFTGATLATSLAVTAGQTVQFQVVFTFS